MDQPTDPTRVERHLQGKFGAGLGEARRAMEQLAHSLQPGELAVRAYHLYE